MNQNIIAFIKRGFHLPDNKQDNRGMVSTINAELMQFGYILTEDAFARMSTADPMYIQAWAKDVINHVKEQMGDGVYTPLHKGFPDSVLAMTSYEKYVAQIMSYWSGGKIVPFEVEGTEYNYEYVEYKEINFIPDINSIFTTLVSINAGLAPVDNRIVDWFIENVDKDTLNAAIPGKVPFKETLGKLASKGLKVPVKTPTDVMRIAAYLSHGSTDLTLPPKYIKPNAWSKRIINPERIKRRWNLTGVQKHLILELLDDVVNPKEMIIRRGMWVTLAHHCKSNKNEHKYPRAGEVLRIMQQKNGYPKSWYADVDRAFDKKFSDGLRKLAERPGEYARRLDALLRKKPKKTSKILDIFRKCAGNVSNKVLFELWTHFNGRLVDQTSRVQWTGERRKPTALPLLKAMSEDTVDAIVEMIWGIISDKFSTLEPLGESYIDPELKKIPLPTNMKSLSESLVVVVRGQRTPFTADKRYLRLYCHWKTRKDLDMTCSTVDMNGKVNKCGYGGQDHNHIIFSGDNTGDYDQNSEYIDIDLHNTTVKYVMMTVNNYSGGPVKEAIARMGWMERDVTERSHQWVPKTVANSFEVTSDARCVNMVIFDLEAKEWILLDEDARSQTAVSNMYDIKNYITTISEVPKYSVYDLLKTHVDARGYQVDEITEKTQTMFEFKDFSSDYSKTLTFMQDSGAPSLVSD